MAKVVFHLTRLKQNLISHREKLIKTTSFAERYSRFSRSEKTMDLLTEEEVLEIAGKCGGGGVRLLGHDLRDKSEVLGYLGKHLTLTLRLSSDEGTTQKRLFLKTYEVKTNSEDFLEETGIFRREQDFYGMVVEDVSNSFEEPDWCPRHFFSKQRVLVLEDLSEKGFKMVDEGHGQWALDCAHLEAALKTLASMHATSLLLERRKSKVLPSLYPTIFGKEPLYDVFIQGTSTRKWIKWQIQDLLEGVNYLDKYSDREKEFVKNNFEAQIMRIYSLSKISEKYRNVITHGDVWKNNFLFCYSEDNLPESCKLVDFQFVRYAPPAHDVMHLLHYATKKPTRDKMELHFRRCYYENLRKQMQENEIDIEEFLSWEKFLESCEEYRELALVQCLLSSHYILGPVTLSVDVESYAEYEVFLTNHRKEYMEKFFSEESYAVKVTDIFQELIERYILKQ